GQAEAAAFDGETDTECDAEHDESHPRENARILELHKRPWRLALHWDRDLAPAGPLENVEQSKRIGEHCKREVEAAKAECDQSDEQTGDAAYRGCQRQADPGRDVVIVGQDHHGESAEAEECRLAEA